MKDNERSDSMWITGGPQSLVMNNRTILTFTPEGEVVFGEGIEPSEAARQFWTLLAHMNPLRGEVERLRASEVAWRNDFRVLREEFERQRDENAAMREIVQAVVAGAAPCTVIDGQCHLLGSCEPEWEGPISPAGYWKHHPDCPVTKARAILAETDAK